MDTLSIEILNPKAKKLLQDMADMDLIAIKTESLESLSQMLTQFKNRDSKRNNSIAMIEKAALDPLFLADVKEINDDFSISDQENL